MRLLVSDLGRGLFKVLRNRNYTPSRPDYVSRGALVVLPAGVGVAVHFGDIAVQAPSAILTGIAILAGGFLASFTHVSTLRLRLTERQDERADSEQQDRDLMDEVATLLLVAAASSVVTAIALIVTMNLAGSDSLTGLAAVVVSVLGTLVAVLFLLTIPRLYNAYVQINNVRTELNGADRRKS